jgi:hypothetical protein
VLKKGGVMLLQVAMVTLQLLGFAVRRQTSMGLEP